MMYVEFMKNSYRADSSELMAFRVISVILSPKTFDSYFQDMMYVGLMEYFRLSDSSELLAIRLVLTYWAQKCLIPTFYTWCTSSWWKFLSRRSSELMALRVISASWPKKRLIPTFETWCTSSWWKIFISPIRASWWLLESFRHPEPKNVWFPLSRHDVRRVHEKFSSRRFERAVGC